MWQEKKYVIYKKNIYLKNIMKQQEYKLLYNRILIIIIQKKRNIDQKNHIHLVEFLNVIIEINGIKDMIVI